MYLVFQWGIMGDLLMGFGFMVQDAGIDDDVVVMTEDFDDLMDEDAVVLPNAHYTSVSHVTPCWPAHVATSALAEGTINTTADAAFAVCILFVQVSMHTSNRLIRVRLDVQNRGCGLNPLG